jgi:hypothetical protein
MAPLRRGEQPERTVHRLLKRQARPAAMAVARLRQQSGRALGGGGGVGGVGTWPDQRAQQFLGGVVRVALTQIVEVALRRRVHRLEENDENGEHVVRTVLQQSPSQPFRVLDLAGRECGVSGQQQEAIAAAPAPCRS